ncbi:Serine/threonine protein phosphatase PrpC [Bryocella elongata]|uniref:Serine/threonine protein phosphatase PrpC n=1 Tax=Bryocella elongata TaxID=863522 RepID=A0A1H6ADJ7_9BACT|nr:PP2C family serine/threonine-protein phosphatase [Bryocella elongata]SEG46117.1 Serine/threonine protein phosphatase PrpC [Bryocella elongata]
MPAKIEVAALSDMGCVRTNNEDNFGYDPANQLYVVCDGMGGMAAGEVASAIACRTLIEVFAAQPEPTAVDVRLFTAIRAANDAVWAAGQLPEHKGMGTTTVVLVVRDNRLLVGNVGDSRAYRIKAGKILQITQDHSYINELIRMGTVSEADRHTVDLKGMETVITRAIGAAATVEPDFFGGDLTPGDMILLASDGLTRYVDKEHLTELIGNDSLEASCQRLIDTARSMGGADNITCILVRYLGLEEEPAFAPQGNVVEPTVTHDFEPAIEHALELAPEPAPPVPAFVPEPDVAEPAVAEPYVEEPGYEPVLHTGMDEPAPGPALESAAAVAETSLDMPAFSLVFEPESAAPTEPTDPSLKQGSTESEDEHEAITPKPVNGEPL